MCDNFLKNFDELYRYINNGCKKFMIRPKRQKVHGEISIDLLIKNIFEDKRK